MVPSTKEWRIALGDARRRFPPKPRARRRTRTLPQPDRGRKYFSARGAKADIVEVQEGSIVEVEIIAD